MQTYKRFRVATIDDVGFITKLEAMPENAFVHSDDAPTHTINIRTAAFHYFIAEDAAGHPLAFAILNGNKSKELEWRRIIVEAAGKGVGRAFMTALLDYFDTLHVPKIWLDVYAENKHAQYLYQALGFEKTHTRPYEKNPAIELTVMERAYP